MKTLLSFDVGIKKLSYCILQLNEENSYAIKEWGIINLITDETENICCYKKKW